MSPGSPRQTKLGPGELFLIVGEKMIIYHAMEPLAEEKIISYLKENITPLNRSSYGPGYRASVYLTDGTFLPCVMFHSAKLVVELPPSSG